MRIDLNLFTVFNAIYTEGNITRAAKVLNLTQPAVSHSLARLREHFDNPLFVREGNRMMPTPVARRIVDDIREALHQLNSVRQQSRSFNPELSNKHFTLSMHDTLESSSLPYLMQVIQQQAPSITLGCVRTRRSALESDLASGDIDAAIDILLPVSDDIKHCRLQQDRLIVIARHGHPDIKGSLDMETYLAQRHVLVSSRVSGPGLEDFELGRLGMQRKVGLRCQHFYTACHVVSQTNLLLTMPEKAAQIFNSGIDNQIFALPADLPQIDVHLYWHVNADNDPANRWLRQHLLQKPVQ